jgi:hypothetical protein
LDSFAKYRKVLEKYCKVRKNKKGPKPDFFYDVLKERVSAVLKEKGIDPVEDRGATIARTLFYIFNFAAWIASGYAHVKVSLDSVVRRIHHDTC